MDNYADNTSTVVTKFVSGHTVSHTACGTNLFSPDDLNGVVKKSETGHVNAWHLSKPATLATGVNNVNGTEGAPRHFGPICNASDKIALPGSAAKHRAAMRL